MKPILMLGLCLLAASADAQSVYKCRDTAGALVYQSAPCSGKTEKQWTADPALAQATATAMDLEAAQQSVERDRQFLQASNRATTLRTVKRNSKRVARNVPSPCERERKARAAAHERRGVRWSFNDASHWDARVFKVCR